MIRNNIRNLAIIAHVDHGKTTLVDAMLKQTHALKPADEESAHLIMDSMDLERERGITIKAKNASLLYHDTKINIVDTPGHADFGGEVERTLKMADGVLLLIDAKEGPMPQTKFVLKKALELGHKAIVVINKVDKPDANPDEALNKTFDLFVKLNANHNQLDFPIIYASGKLGLADTDLERLTETIKSERKFAPEPVEGQISANKLLTHSTSSGINNLPTQGVSALFDAIVQHIPAPEVQLDDVFAMQILALAYDNYKGRLGIGKIQAGKIAKSQNTMLIKIDGARSTGKISSLQMYEGLKQIDVEEAVAGDIVAVGGFDDIHIGDILTDPNNPKTLPPVEIEPPTIKMTFGVNTSPFAGREGKFVTSRNLRDRLIKELETNVALKIDGLEEGSDSFLVSGRGELHLAVLVETMRREGFELQVSQPQVIYHFAKKTEVGASLQPAQKEGGSQTLPNSTEADTIKLEPYEIVTIDIPSEHQGVIIEELSKRGGQIQHMDSSANSSDASAGAGELHAEYLIPTRGLIGLKNLLLTRTRGTVVINNLFDSYKPARDIDTRANDHGSLIASESGVSNAYGLNNAQERGQLFIGPAVEVYEGMVAGKNSVDEDLELNVCKTKKLSNMRSKGADEAILLTPPKLVELDFALEYIGSDELVEVTPKSIRIRKKILSAIERKRQKRDEKSN